MLVNGEFSLQLEAIKPPLQLQSRFDALRQVLFFEDLLQLPYESLIQHMILDVLCQTRPYKTTRRYIHFVPIFFRSFPWLFFQRRVSLRLDAVNASITSHLHIPKLFFPSIFTTSIFTPSHPKVIFSINLYHIDLQRMWVHGFHRG